MPEDRRPRSGWRAVLSRRSRRARTHLRRPVSRVRARPQPDPRRPRRHLRLRARRARFARLLRATNASGGPDLPRDFPTPQGDSEDWTRVQHVHHLYHHPDYFCPEPYARLSVAHAHRSAAARARPGLRPADADADVRCARANAVARRAPRRERAEHARARLLSEARIPGADSRRRRPDATAASTWATRTLAAIREPRSDSIAGRHMLALFGGPRFARSHFRAGRSSARPKRHGCCARCAAATGARLHGEEVAEFERRFAAMHGCRARHRRRQRHRVPAHRAPRGGHPGRRRGDRPALHLHLDRVRRRRSQRDPGVRRHRPAHVQSGSARRSKPRSRRAPRRSSPSTSPVSPPTWTRSWPSRASTGWS